MLWVYFEGRYTPNIQTKKKRVLVPSKTDEKKRKLKGFLISASDPHSEQFVQVCCLSFCILKILCLAYL